MDLRLRARRAAEALVRPCAVLMYHRIASVERDPWRLCVRPSSFRDQVRVMVEDGGVTPLASLATAGGRLRHGRAPFAITFDDGFADNVTTGLPILEALDAPATIFVVSGALGRRRAYWWDALERLVFDVLRLPEALETTIAGAPFRWRADERDRSDRSADRLFRADDGIPATHRQELYLSLWSALVTVHPEEQDAAIDRLESWAGLAPEADPAAVPITAEDLARLAGHPLVTIGSHTASHRPLTLIDDAALKDELATSRKTLEAICNRPVTLFSYPYGFVDRRAAGAVQAAGYEAAFCSHHGLAGVASDRFRLPRLQAFDDPADRFRRRLSERYPAVCRR
jgi:peptidoglycan/xylan/chitin deacetylase (PgdA/CDA1 family)